MNIIPSGTYPVTVLRAKAHTGLHSNLEYIKFELGLEDGLHIEHTAVVDTPSYKSAVEALGLEGYVAAGPGTVAVLAQGKKARAVVHLKNISGYGPRNVVLLFRRENGEWEKTDETGIEDV